jgi:hypothetical protein
MRSLERRILVRWVYLLGGACIGLGILDVVLLLRVT